MPRQPAHIWSALHGRRTRLPVAVQLAAAVCLFALTCTGIDIEQTQWGFDGRIVPRSFTVLTVLVSNPTPEAFEGAVTLMRADFNGEQRGARLMQPCVLAPYGSRWLQFYPRTPNQSYQKWKLSWGRGPGTSVELPPPTVGPPAVVYLAPSSVVRAARVKFRSYEAALFPPMLGAAQGLHGVVLDHAPRWESTRRRCFLDWVKTGGIVHLCRGMDGDWPEFTGDLAVLNSDAEKNAVGAGMVVRYDMPTAQLTPAVLQARGFGVPTLESGQNAVLARFDNPILQRLSGCVVATHNWSLMLWMTVVYLILLCPVNYIVGRRGRRVTVPLAFFGGTVLVFSLAFQVIGRRGYGENASVFTMSHARPISEGRYSVTQWSSAFVTRSDAYVITHPSPQNLYATCQEMEAVNGVIQNGRDGAFSVVMPLYSKRSFVHQGTMTGPAITARVTHWFEPGNTVVIETTGLPALKSAWLYRSGRFHRMRVHANGVLRSEGGSQDSAQFLDPNALNSVLLQGQVFHRRRNRNSVDAQAVVEQTMDELMKPVIANALGGVQGFSQRIAIPGADSDDRGLLFLFAESPPTFGIQSPKPIGNETGYTVYEIPLHAPISPGASTL